MAQEMSYVSSTDEAQLGLDVMPAHRDKKHNGPCALMRGTNCPTSGDTLAEVEG